MEATLFTTLTPRLILQLPTKSTTEVEGIVHYAKVTAMTFLEREFAEMMFDVLVKPTELKDLLDTMCVKISKDFNAAMIDSGYAMMTGKFECSSAHDYELSLDVAYDGEAPSVAVH